MSYLPVSADVLKTEPPTNNRTNLFIVKYLHVTTIPGNSYWIRRHTAGHQTKADHKVVESYPISQAGFTRAGHKSEAQSDMCY